MDKKLEGLLAAREYRWKLRQSMASTSPGCLITVTLRVPWKYRTSPGFMKFMERLCEMVRYKLTSERVCIDDSRWIIGEDGPALFLSVNSNAARTKQVCIETEESLSGGQLLDIDVMNKDGAVVSRELLGFSPRKCFICDKPAIICASRRLHSQQELADAIEKFYNLALANRIDIIDG